jgi:GT2 family glycosyltransferase
VYADVDFLSDDGSIWPLAFPAFDYERMLEQGYCACLFAVRRVAAERSIATGASNLYRIFNSALEDGNISAANVVHLPGALGTLPPFDKYTASCVLADATGEHLRHKGVQATVTLRHGGVLPAVQITRKCNAASVTVIIPTRNRHDLLRNCIESIRPAVERIQAEILIVDNDSADSATLECFAETDKLIAKIIRVPGEFNFATLHNCAAKAANGEILCFLDNGVKALNDQWLDEMLSRISERDVGAVGALLIWPSKVVRHGGIVLGPSFAVADAFNDRLDGDVGYCDLLRVAHECSAVTAACLATRRDYFFAVGGMDEVQFPINFNDVDYCLKLRASGKRIVFTPHAKLWHLESASRRRNGTAGHKDQFERELQNLRAKWGAVLAADPYYSPILSRDPNPFSALAWPPGPIEPRANKRPVGIEIPAGF